MLFETGPTCIFIARAYLYELRPEHAGEEARLSGWFTAPAITVISCLSICEITMASHNVSRWTSERYLPAARGVDQ